MFILHVVALYLVYDRSTLCTNFILFDVALPLQSKGHECAGVPITSLRLWPVIWTVEVDAQRTVVCCRLMTDKRCTVQDYQDVESPLHVIQRTLPLSLVSDGQRWRSIASLMSLTCRVC